MEEKKVILVTGGASGIGFGTIEYLLEQEKYEVISFSRGENNINLAKEKLKERANDVLFLQGDISNEDDCKKVYEEIAPTVEFLLSDKCLWTTGGIYLVDGGKSI